MTATTNGATGSRIVTALEAAWAAIQQRHPEVPDVVVITGTAAQKGGDRWGHHWPQRWTLARGTGRVPELFIAGELLQHGGRAVMQTLMHEATHALATVREVADVSDGGRYHNRRFAELARELGLTPPTSPARRVGLADVELGDSTAAAYADTIAAIDAAAQVYLEDQGATGGASTTGGARSGNRRTVTCACDPPRRISITPAQLDAGPLLCGLCHKPFDEDDLEETQS